MANIIQIKHGTEAPGAGVLQEFELGYCTSDGLLYIGQGKDEEGKDKEAKVVGSKLVNTINSNDTTSGVTGKAVADYASQNYLKLSGNQTLNGNLTINSPLNINGVNYPAIGFKHKSEDNEDIGGIVFSAISHRGWLKSFATDTTYCENFLFPAPSDNLEEEKNYNILTTKSLVTIAQGGTGANTAKQARLNLAVSSYGEADYSITATAESPKNFNDPEFRTLGKYGVASNALAGHIDNIPETYAGVLEVSNTTGQDKSSGAYTYLRQVYRPYNRNYYYSRCIQAQEDGSSWSYGNWEKSNNYLPLAGGTMTGAIHMDVAGASRGYYLKDKTGFDYPAMMDNSTNLWIGAAKTATKHHTGFTIISSGYNSDESKGNNTIMISVPNAANNGATNYDVWHEGLVSFKTS